MAVKKIKENEKGQAIFELLVFMPILIFLYTLIFNVGNSINVSINQQKATRRYYYFLAKGNSYIPFQAELGTYGGGVVRVGASMIGYADRLDGDSGSGQPVAPCFRFNSLFSDSDQEDCEDPTTGERQTSYVRVSTAYGVCGAFYTRAGNRWIIPNSGGAGEPDPNNKNNVCTISDGD